MLVEDMIMKTAIVHILDSAVGVPVLSDTPLEVGSDFTELLKKHIEKITESDETKNCSFGEESEVGELLRAMTPDNFIDTSKQLTELLYEIMNENIEIPAADIAICIVSAKSVDYMAFLKLDYHTSYTHTTKSVEEGNSNMIILQKALLPSTGQKLSEAFVLNLNDGSLQVVEKKHEVNGEKSYYFTEMFLKCKAPLSEKSRLDIVTKAITQVADKFYDEEDAAPVKMELKNIICTELEENGAINVPALRDKVFKDEPEMLEALDEKLEKYNMAYETVTPKAEKTIAKFQKQKITTDTGIEITIPMEEYRNPDHVEFITNADGTISVLIKNIGLLTSR